MLRKTVFPAAAGLPFFAGRLKRTAAIALCACMLALAGCSDLSFEAADLSPAPLPTPDTSAMTAPAGDSRARYSIRATLYYRTQDGQLSSALRLIHVDPDDEPLELIVESLLETPYSSSGLLPIAPAGTRLNSVRFSGGVATVDLSAEALSQGEEQFYIARAAIAKTLLGRGEVEAVNVLVNGRAAETGGLPLGALTKQDTNASMGYIQQLSEQLLFESDGAFIERNAIVYLPISQNEPLLPVNVGVQLGSEDYMPTLIAEYARLAPQELLPTEYAGMISAEESITTAGERVLTLRFPQEMAAYAPAERIIPGLAATLCSFVPNIDIARAYIGQEIVLSAGGFGCENGVFDPQLFRTLAGSSAQLFFQTEKGTLRREDHVIASCSLTARDLIAALIAGPADGSGLLHVFPEGALAEDILGVRIEDYTAHVHISAELYSMCQSLSPEQERALVYAIVNTLVYNLDTVLRVQFYVDGDTADMFAGTISIRTPLMANPGLVE